MGAVFLPYPQDTFIHEYAADRPCPCVVSALSRIKKVVLAYGRADVQKSRGRVWEREWPKVQTWQRIDGGGKCHHCQIHILE